MAQQDVSTEIEIVERFLGALEKLDIDAAVALLDRGVVYQNVPLPPARGLRAVEKQLRWMGRYGSGFEVVHHNIASNGTVVLTERTDILTVGRLSAAFWVCGTFEVRDGKITLWRDRFDMVDFALSWVRGAVKLLLSGNRT